MNKLQIRKECLERRQSMEEEKRQEKSKIIGELLKREGIFRDSKVLLLYAACGSEVSLDPLIHELLVQKEKKLFFPKVTGEDMEFYEVNEWKELIPGFRGIREPEAGEERRFRKELLQRDSCLMIMPGVGFDSQGNRLGYGKGFYDRYLRDKDKLLRIGVAFQCQMTNRIIPVDSYDKKVDIILTEYNRITI